MTLEELAYWIADSPPTRLMPDGHRWKAIHARALDALEQAYALGRASKAEKE